MKKVQIREVNFDGEKFYIYKAMPQWRNFVKGASELPSQWEKLTSKTIVNEIKPDWNFADIGASFGTHTLLVTKRTSGMCYAFEPNSINFVLLKANLSKFNNVKCINKALGDESIKLNLSLSPPGTGSHSLAVKISEKSEVVEVITLDSLNLHIDMMKIDVEGYGYKVLKGADKTLINTKLIIFEFHYDEDDVFELLKSKGFRLVFNKGPDSSNKKSFVAFKIE